MRKLFTVIISIFLTTIHSQELFFSEYSEGSSYNKYLEIFNPGSQTINLSDYAIASVSNSPDSPGQHERWLEFSSDATISSGEIYLIVQEQADQSLVSQADLLISSSSVYWTGDDGIALVLGIESNYTVIDVIGQNITESTYSDPGSGWDVAGISLATRDHTLIRKSSITSGNTDWVSSAGTDADNSEWIVFDQDHWDDIGTHSIYDYTIVVFSIDANDYNEYLNGEDEPNLETIYVTGSFENWTGWGVALTDPDYDGIYEGSSPIPEGTEFEFKFLLGGWGSIESLPEIGSVCDFNPNDFYPNYGAIVGTDTTFLPTYVFGGGCATINQGPIFYVSASGSDSNDGSQENPFATIQAGINAASDGDTVLVQPGTYVENINFNGKNIVVGSLMLTTGDTSYISSTIIDGNQSGSVVKIENNELNPIIFGLTIQNGHSDVGGGIFIEAANANISNCLIKNNTSTNNGWLGGGGIYHAQTGMNDNSWGQNTGFLNVESCVISHNKAGTSGGYGGGIYVGGMSELDTHAIIKNTLIYNNEAGLKGGGVATLLGVEIKVINSTISKNLAGDANGGFYSESGNEIINSIIYHNEPVNIYDCGAAFRYSNIEEASTVSGSGWDCGQPTLDNIITLDPKFVDLNNNNFTLQAGSPCIGAGNPENTSLNDINGNIRPNPQGSNPDIGAYESSRAEPYFNYPPLISSIPDTTIFEDAGLQSFVVSGISSGNESDSQVLTITPSVSNGPVDTIFVQYYNPSDSAVVYFAAETDSSGTFVVTLKLKDDGGIQNGAIDSVLTNFTITVLPVNDKPNIAPLQETVSMNEDDTLAITIVANDIDGDSLTFSNYLSQFSYSSINNNILTIHPEENFSGILHDTVVVSDGTLLDSSIYVINVLPVNDKPVISSINDTTMNEDSYLSFNVDRFIADIEHDNLLKTAWVDTTEIDTPGLLVNYNDYDDDSDYGHIIFYPEENWYGSATIKLSAIETDTDELYGDTISFNLTVLPVNDAPIMTAISDTSFYEDDSLTIALTAFDVDNDNLSFYEPYDQNYVSVVDDTLVLKAPENWNGQFWSYIHVSDGDLYDSTEFMVDIIPVNDAPTISELNDTTMLEDSFLKMEFNSYDVDGDTLSYEVWSDKDFGQIQIDLSGNSSDYENDSLLITPHPNWFGNAEIYVRVFDNALSDTMNFTLEVESVDDLPTADMPFADVTLYEDSPDTTLGNLDSLFTDIDGELEFSVTVGDTNLIDVTIIDNLVLMNIIHDAFGITDIVFTATNPTRAMVKDTVLVEILPINDPPTIDAIADTTILEDSGQLIINLTGISSGAFNEYQELTISATFSDSTVLGNIGPHNYYYNSPDSVGTIELFTNINVFGSTDVIIELNDNAGDSISTQFTVNVESVNDAPQLEIISLQTIKEDSVAVVKIVASDVEDDYLTFSAISDTNGVETFMYGDSLVLVPLPDWNGETSITVTASDGELIDTTYFSLHVIPIDDEPVIAFNILDLFLQEDFSDTVLARLDTVFNDIDGSLTYSYNISDSSIFSANISSDGILELNANQNAFGEAQLVIIASNPTRASVSDTIEVIVASVNDTPIIDVAQDSLILVEDTQDATINIMAYDVETAELMYDGFSDTSAVQIAHVDTGLYTIDLEPHWFGTSMLTLFVKDEDGGSDTITVSLNVTPVNDVPEFVSELNALVGVGIEFNEEIDTYDADMDQLTLSFNTQQIGPDWLTLNGNIISGIPPINGDFPLLLDLSDNDTTITDTFHLSVEVFNPVITSIVDVPEDQGGWVYLGFNASYFDSGDETGQQYDVYRYDTYQDTSAWIMVASGSAIYQDQYVFEVHTSGDSTEENDGMTMYKVVASMNEGIFHSPPDSGYSIDNIAPGVPTGIQAIAMENSISLSWDMSEAEDFQYFVLERSNEAAGEIADTTITYELIEVSFEDHNLGTQC